MAQIARAALAVLTLAAAGLVQAATIPAFETSLEALRERVVGVRAEQREARLKTDAAAIKGVDKDVAELTRFAWRQRNQLNDIRRRCRFRTPPQPGIPDNDPFLSNDVQRHLYYLRNYARLMRERERDATALAAGATKDPSLVEPAQRLQQDAGELKAQARALAIEGRDAGWDLRSAGFNIEAMDEQRYTRIGTASGDELEAQARLLVDRVR